MRTSEFALAGFIIFLIIFFALWLVGALVLWIIVHLFGVLEFSWFNAFLMGVFLMILKWIFTSGK